MDDEDTDQRLPHQKSPNELVSSEKLAALGLLTYSGLTGPEDPRLDQIRSERGYSYNDVCEVCPEKLPEFEKKIQMFYRKLVDVRRLFRIATLTKASHTYSIRRAYSL